MVVARQEAVKPRCCAKGIRPTSFSPGGCGAWSSAGMLSRMWENRR
ncbi:hypothetical protein KCP76_20165 [Salmonella enterica subsp. enterica serovar Weltevreden]|nr:hypothetical protein KCP76_20165 [Salmonella enterica subsp. enterica serovar Weltevreden]